VTRINGIVHSPELRPLFVQAGSNLFNVIEEFIGSTERVLHVCLDKLPTDFQAREIFMNLIGRKLLKLAKAGKFARHCPLLVFLDEAHNFLNKHVGEEDFRLPLDAFEKIAKEGRKFWLNLVLATQQPRDVPPGILSQMGTLIVHRLINEADRKVVETACGQLDAAAAKFLPSLGPGEVAIIGVDFPIPLTIQIEQPPKNLRPNSEGPKFTKWLQPRPLVKQLVPARPAPARPKPVVAKKEVAPPDEEDDVPF
jgi:DNA helicase HerA-like ATPase